jgi:hypothetical protein
MDHRNSAIKRSWKYNNLVDYASPVQHRKDSRPNYSVHDLIVAGTRAQIPRRITRRSNWPEVYFRAEAQKGNCAKILLKGGKSDSTKKFTQNVSTLQEHAQVGGDWVDTIVWGYSSTKPGAKAQEEFWIKQVWAMARDLMMCVSWEEIQLRSWQACCKYQRHDRSNFWFCGSVPMRERVRNSKLRDWSCLQAGSLRISKQPWRCSCNSTPLAFCSREAAASGCSSIEECCGTEKNSSNFVIFEIFRITLVIVVHSFVPNASKFRIWFRNRISELQGFVSGYSRNACHTYTCCNSGDTNYKLCKKQEAAGNHSCCGQGHKHNNVLYRFMLDVSDDLMLALVLCAIV